MQITLDAATVEQAVNEEQILTLQAQIKHLEARVIQLNAINRKLTALVVESEEAAATAQADAEDARLEAAVEYPDTEKG